MRDNRQMELRHLRYFVAVAEEMNISRAAARLRVSQPPLSRQIRDLEEEIGVTLFDRQHKRLKLTSAGHISCQRQEGYFRTRHKRPGWQKPRVQVRQDRSQLLF